MQSALQGESVASHISDSEIENCDNCKVVLSLSLVISDRIWYYEKCCVGKRMEPKPVSVQINQYFLKIIIFYKQALLSNSALVDCLCFSGEKHIF